MSVALQNVKFHIMKNIQLEVIFKKYSITKEHKSKQFNTWLPKMITQHTALHRRPTL